MLLLLWEEKPETIKSFVLPLKHNAAQMARKSSNLFVGGDELPTDHEIFKLLRWVGSKDAEHYSTKLPIKSGNITQVVRCGIIL